MINYPSNIKRNYQKKINYGNRGMDLEHLINITNDKYIEKDIAIIYKKPTPIGIVKYNYDTKRITEAYYQSQSTLDYNGVYKGYYIEFDAKNTNKNYLPLANIAPHQILHIEKTLHHGGIIFILVMINNECYILSGQKLIDFINKGERKSISYEYFVEHGVKVEYNYLKGVDYIKGVDLLIKENEENEKKEIEA